MPWYSPIKKDILDNYFDGITIAIGLLKSTYTHDPDQEFIDDGGAADVIDHECDATNYARKTVAIGTGDWTVDDTNDIVTLDIADQTFTSLGGATNNTVNALFIANNAGGADTARVLICTVPFASHTTDGNDFTLNISELMRGTN